MPRSAKVTEATALPYDRQGWLAVAVLAIGLAMVAGDFLIASSNFSTAPPSSILFATVPYWVIGAFLLWRQPRVRIGWVLLAFAFFWSLTFLSIDFAQFALQRGMGGTLFSAWVGEWAWLLALLIVFVVIPLLFPTGRPQSRGWATVLKSSMGFAVVFVVATTFQRYFDTGVRLENPWARLPIDDVEDILLPVAIPLLVLGAVAAIVRYRRSRGLERQQLRWFVFSVFLTIVLFVVNGIIEPTGQVGEIPIVISLSAPAVAIGIAVMRYRLFEIDRIITRTITYGVVTTLLIAVYAGTVFLITSLVPTAQSLAVAGATLLAAGLFAPLRKRAQALVDRRFNRSTYDARITMEQLSNRLASEVDVAALGSEVRSVITSTMQPEKVAVWIR